MTEQEAKGIIDQIQALAPHYHMEVQPGKESTWLILGHYDEAGGSPYARKEFVLRNAGEAREMIRQLSGPTAAKGNGTEYGELL